MSKRQTFSFWHRNGLSLTFLALLVVSLVGQILTGQAEWNGELVEKYGQQPLGLWEYLGSGHFISATFENWESEFLQMGMYVLFTVFLRQKGSAESKALSGREKVDREPQAKAEAPWPVRRGGWWLKIYRNSLSIAFFTLFLLSWILHLYGSWKDYNTEQMLDGLPTLGMGAYLGEPKFWFESFQNWQSEFLSVASIVVLSIFLRQHGSPESKPVDAPDDETGA
jgi:hypothetical protein